MTVTAIRRENSEDTISLTDLVVKGKPNKSPWLTFKDLTWDNPDYIKNFLRGIKKDKRQAVLELRKICKEKGFDYDLARLELLSIYKESKKLKLWIEV